MTALPLAVLLALVAGQLPTPPDVVKLPASNGEVRMSHPNHLARRETCKTCHGEGPVRPITLDKDSGHALCRGCHEAKGGPTRCSACHVGPWKVPPKEPAD